MASALPVFDGGARRANVDAARARYDEAASAYAATLRKAVREVEEALVNLQSTADRSADAQTAADDYEVSFRATEARYKSGLASLFELEDARRSALAAQIALVDLQRERVAAWIALYRAARRRLVARSQTRSTAATSPRQPRLAMTRRSRRLLLFAPPPASSSPRRPRSSSACAPTPPTTRRRRPRPSRR